MPEQLITIAEARTRVLAEAQQLDTDLLAVGDALGRVLAEDVHAAGNVPPFACSAMDGYALDAEHATDELTVVGESRAGAPSTQDLGPGQAIRISTGAALPPGATAVIRQEDVHADNGRIRFDVDVQPGENVRGPGEDMRAGTFILARGTRLGAAELGAAVAAGRGALTCTRRPRVAVLCTGDELKAPGESLGPGQIHNSNAVMLRSLALRHGAAAGRVERLADDRGATEAALANALATSDVLVISGGVSVGPHDHVKPALAALGVEQRFWGIALQPGKPTWFGVSEGKLVFGLPGNPVSAFVTFTLFAGPALDALQGCTVQAAGDASAPLAAATKRNPGREQAIRVRLERRGDQTVAVSTGPQASHIITSLLGADALALIAPGEGELDAGTEVPLVMLR